jgi:hypothetical protein
LVDGIPQQSNLYTFIAKQEGTYQVVLENTENKCTSNSINEITITVHPAPMPVSISLDGSPTFCEGGEVTLLVTSETGFNYQWFNQDGNIANSTTNSYTATQTGTYSVQISSEYQCEYIPGAKNIVAAETPPQQTIQTIQNTNICPGDEVELSVAQNDNYTYQWKLDGIDINNEKSHILTATAKGKYTAAINNYTCGITTEPIEVTYKPALPKPSLLAEGPNVWILACDNTTAQVYKWYYNGNFIPEATRYLYVANQTLGEYYVTVNDGGECHVPSDILTIPLNTTGIKDAETVFGNIKIYPNPTPGMFTIEMDNQIKGTLNIRIVNEQGKELFNIQHNKTTTHLKTEMDLSGQGSGVYFIQFRFGEEVEVKKVVEE